jgi:peptidoglycan/xylan/chitin deacetylase (PgdA/CDA1 family)
VSPRFRSLFLCYHAVSETWEHPLSVGLRNLEVLVRSLIRRGYRPAGVEEGLRRGGRLLHVTFDDAYRSVLTALPTLRALGVPVTVFACPGYADQGSVPYMPELTDEVTAHGELLVTMDWDELRELASHGVTIGSHTVTHPHLPELSDGELRRELGASRERVETELGARCRYLAYPYGEENARVRAVAREVGYEAAFTLDNWARPMDPYAVPRLVINRGDTLVRATLKTWAPARRTVQAVLRPLRQL